MRLSIVKPGLSLLVSVLLAACGDSGSKSDSSANASKSQSKPAITSANSEKVNFALISDDALRQCVERTGVRKTDQLQILECTDSNIKNLSGLVQFSSLAVLNLSNNKVSDLTPLASVKSLAALTLSHNQISDIAPLSGLTKLKTLAVAHNQLNALEGIQDMTGLKKLYADHNQIDDLNPVSNTQLQFLVAHQNPAPLPNSLPGTIRSFRI